MKMRRMVMALALCGAAATVFAGGGQQGGGGNANAGKIVLSIRNMDEDFLRLYADNVKKLAAEKKIEINIQDARSDSAQQLTQIQTALNQGYKYFVVIPCVSELSDEINAAVQAKGGAAAYSNINPTVSSLKVRKTVFLRLLS